MATIYQPQEYQAIDDVPYQRGRPLPTVTPVFQNKLPNSPGKTAVGLLVDFPPNASTPPHTHGGAAISVFVIKGTVLNKMNDGPTRVIPAGGSWFEAPGCHHRTSDNYSTTEPAQILATMVVDTTVVEEGGMAALVVLDPEYADIRLG
ncbi:cupin domain-containing protein [Trichoderma gracile]